MLPQRQLSNFAVPFQMRVSNYNFIILKKDVYLGLCTLL